MLNKKEILTVPNFITLVRLFLVIPVFYFMKERMVLEVLSLYFLFILLDAFDGIIARRYNQITRFGKYFDIIVDSLLHVAIITILISENPIFSPAMLVFLSAIVIVVLYFFVNFIEIKMWLIGGRVKRISVVFLFVTIFLMMIRHLFEYNKIIDYLAYLMMYSMIGFTIYYFIRLRLRK